MGSEEGSSIAQLRLLSCVALMESEEASGMHTPPLQTSASVPFHWEEEPGKPRPCTALIALPVNNPTTNKCLELQLPPRLVQQKQQLMHCCKAITKSPSPTTVFDGPYEAITLFPTSPSRLSPFDCFQIGHEMRSSSSSANQKGNGLLGLWAHKAQKSKNSLKLGGSDREATDGSLVFSSHSMDDDEVVNMAKNKRNGGFLRISHVRSNFWATVFKRFKQVIPWKKRIWKK